MGNKQSSEGKVVVGRDEVKPSSLIAACGGFINLGAGVCARGGEAKREEGLAAAGWWQAGAEEQAGGTAEGTGCRSVARAQS